MYYKNKFLETFKKLCEESGTILIQFYSQCLIDKILQNRYNGDYTTLYRRSLSGVQQKICKTSIRI